jgi:CHAT domain-containing protein/Tfp pilus assembly protein PilF
MVFAAFLSQRGKTMRNLRAALLVLLFAAALPAQDRPQPDTPEQAADKVPAAFKAKDGKTLKVLAEKDDPDPWLVADEMCFRGEQDAAEAFAEAAARPRVGTLYGYVARQRNAPASTEHRRLLESVADALDAKKPDVALAALDASTLSAATVVSIRLMYARAVALRQAGRLRESARAFDSAGDRARKTGWLRRAEQAFWNSAMILEELGENREALERLARLREVVTKSGDRPQIAKALGQIGRVHSMLGEWAKAAEYYTQALAHDPDEVTRAGFLVNLGNSHRVLGRYREALECFERALPTWREKRHSLALGTTLLGIGMVHKFRADYEQALEVFERARDHCRDAGAPGKVAGALNNIAEIQKDLGEYQKALGTLERALDIYRRVGDESGAAYVLSTTCAVYDHLGMYAQALGCIERALEIRERTGDERAAIPAHINAGNVYDSTGDYEKALRHYETAHRLAQKHGSPQASTALLNMGLMHERRRDYARALEIYDQALSHAKALDHDDTVGVILCNIGAAYLYSGEIEKAVRYQERALGNAERTGNRYLMVLILQLLGEAHASAGDHKESEAWFRRAIALADRMGERFRGVGLRAGLASVRLEQGLPREASKLAREAVSEMGTMLSHLAQEHGALARGQFGRVFEVGARASLKTGDAADLWFFLESGRAGTLLESLGGRDKLRATSLPEDLLREEAEAQSAEAVARKLYLRALDLGERKELQRRRQEFDQAREARKAVIERIQREEKAAANVLYPKADSLEEIQASLRKDEALVLYALLKKDALALALTTKEARIVPLAGTDEIAAACGAIRAGVLSGATRGFAFEKERPDASLPGAIAKLRKLVVEPLGLGRDVKRLLASPHGALSYVPFALLAGDREVGQVPSGTTYRLLIGERGLRGEGVLGLGDPDYETKVDTIAKTVYRAGGRGVLWPLPGTRAEVRALADVKLLGKDATEAGLQKALGQRARWHAVHLACHGLVDPERPTLSSLALTADSHNDGFLTALEVFRMKIPADLVVLSACETGRGKVVNGEGIVGMTRAFMFAGAPRVIVSLWKVDDDATRALMVKFYGLWNPKDGSRGLPTAAALKKAQEFVASHEKWKHPYYWAAWQLWGLPD